VPVVPISGQQDIGVASCVANRQSPQAEKLVGHFSNHVIFRTSLTDNPTFRDVLHQVRNTALTAYSYQDLPFGSLIEQLENCFWCQSNELFQVLLVLTEVPEEKWSFPGLDVRLLPLNVGTTAYDLIVWLKLEERLEVDLQYNSDLFEAATIRQILANYGAVLGVMSKIRKRGLVSSRLRGSRQKMITVHGSNTHPKTTWDRKTLSNHNWFSSGKRF